MSVDLPPSIPTVNCSSYQLLEQAALQGKQGFKAGLTARPECPMRVWRQGFQLDSCLWAALVFCFVWFGFSSSPRACMPHTCHPHLLPSQHSVHGPWLLQALNMELLNHGAAALIPTGLDLPTLKVGTLRADPGVAVRKCEGG